MVRDSDRVLYYGLTSDGPSVISSRLPKIFTPISPRQSYSPTETASCGSIERIDHLNQTCSPAECRDLLRELFSLVSAKSGWSRHEEQFVANCGILPSSVRTFVLNPGSGVPSPRARFSPGANLIRGTRGRDQNRGQEKNHSGYSEEVDGAAYFEMLERVMTDGPPSDVDMTSTRRGCANTPM
jgi:hypothetical protein